MRPFGHGPHSSRITFRREYSRILTHKIFKSAAYGNYEGYQARYEPMGLVWVAPAAEVAAVAVTSYACLVV
jgi:hypothetical protein